MRVYDSMLRRIPISFIKKRIGYIYFIIMYLNNKNYGRLQD